MPKFLENPLFSLWGGGFAFKFEIARGSKMETNHRLRKKTFSKFTYTCFYAKSRDYVNISRLQPVKK